MATAADLIAEFGRRIELPRLELGREGICSVVVGDRIEISFEAPPASESLVMTGHLGPLPTDRSDFLLALLRANYNGDATDGGAIAIDPRSGEVVLSKRLDLDGLEIEGFAACVERFVRFVTFWIDYLPKLSQTVASGGAPADLGFEVPLIRV